ncbi:MAG: hypothetical protein AVDCRST_MAG76-2629 [uncultured Acidimicrobiales bacterium]|uniref:Uncharacterized protein n=1 Tax=uncultured Acidimicrobiales bacterium TaxID=310071 RepID=A0A6J4IRN1_9ACTN|nr:MAG: hypothetical protein AVDCRST_MAG76-2629 [uncultured Acidimicrobiales bacterium]
MASSWLLMSASRRQSKLRPSRAAATRRSRMPGAAPSRRRTVSANVAGMTRPGERSRTQPSAVFSNSWAWTIPANSSSTRNGSPSALATTTSASSRGTAEACRQPAATKTTSSSLSLGSSTMDAERRVARPWTHVKALLDCSLRSETKQKTGSPAMLSARYSTTSIVSASAHCRSSSTSTQPAPSPRVASSLSTASPRTTSDSSPGDSPGRRHSGTSRPRMGRKGASSRTCGGPDLRRCENSASATGRKGSGLSRSTARPVNTSAPRRTPSSAVSLNRRDLPTPASPATTAVAPCPSARRSRARRSSCHSCSRPTTTGHSSSRTQTSMPRMRALARSSLRHEIGASSWPARQTWAICSTGQLSPKQ